MAYEIKKVLTYPGVMESLAVISALTAFLWNPKKKSLILVKGIITTVLAGLAAYIAVMSKNWIVVILTGILFIAEGIHMSVSLKKR